MTVRDAGLHYGYSPEYIRFLIRQGHVTATKLNCKLLVVNIASLEAYINSKSTDNVGA